MKLSPTLNVAASVIVIACLTLTQATPSAFAQAQAPGANGLATSDNKDGAAASGALVASAAAGPAPRGAAPQEKSRKKKWIVLAVVAGAAAGVLGIVLSRGETENTITVGPPTVGP
jgi:predicted metal-binding membrane protein